MKVTTTRNVYISQYTYGFDPSKPESCDPGSLHITSGDEAHWAKNGYTKVGTAQIEIEFMSRDEMTANAVSSLRKQKESVLAEAQAEATRIDGEIQNLLAITNEA